jgi:hypothetical protein
VKGKVSEEFSKNIRVVVAEAAEPTAIEAEVAVMSLLNIISLEYRGLQSGDTLHLLPQNTPCPASPPIPAASIP